MKAQRLHAFAWGLAATVSLLAIVAWGQGLDWQFDNLSAYSLFPLLGLLAFSLMWTHYIVGATRRMRGTDKQTLKPYFAITGWIVLICICLHPGLLIGQLWRDGFGFPPNSYLKNYVAPGLEWAALLGTTSWLAFMAFETKHWFGKKSWWKLVELLNVAAMFAILVHSLYLGSNLQAGWLRSVWYFYGVSLLVSVVYIYLP